LTDGDLFAEKTKIKMVFVDGKKISKYGSRTGQRSTKGDMTKVETEIHHSPKAMRKAPWT